MIRIVTCLTLAICLACSVFAQSEPKKEQNESKSKNLLEAAKRKGSELPVNLSVQANVRAQAVLIPQVDAKRIFGREIADNYAVIQLIVSNKSSDAALIIHGVFVDYSRWALSGATNNAPSLSIDGQMRERDEQFQTITSPNHIASEEYRVVRGQLLDAQTWTKRNWLVRALTLLGSVAGATTFSFNQAETRLIAAFNGTLVPGVETLWPDRTVDQLNRVSDFGYQANKVIPQHGAEVIVCFFPIDRFLTPGFRKLFLKSPALFFAPLLMLEDETITAEVSSVLGSELGTKIKIDALRKSLPCYLRIDQQRREETKQAITAGAPETFKEALERHTTDSCLGQFGLSNTSGKIHFINEDEKTKKMFEPLLILDYISQTSLNSVTVVVDGVMTVDTTVIASKIDGIGFDELPTCGNHHRPCFWTNTDTSGGVRTGMIDGSYLTGGQIRIKEAEDLGIKEIKTITDGSSDQALQFSFKLTKPLANQTRLHFSVAKPIPGAAADAKNSKSKESLPWEYVVDYGANSAPSVTEVKFDAKESTLTVTGEGFVNAPPKNPLVVTLHTPGGEDIAVKPDPNSISTTRLVLPMEKPSAGCWSVQVSVGTNPSLEREKREFMIAPSPKLVSAKRQADKNEVVVKGKDLIEISDCSGKKLDLNFQLVKATDEQEVTPILLVPTSKSQEQWTFNLPHRAERPGTKWKVRMLVNGKSGQGSHPVPLQ